ncbi:hypothetical protein U8D42_28860 (plasmid) [Mycobacterium europaeum]|uniref:Integral membrane protein n=4 Tax=Mycobacterium TaxID=1763 RepID=A0A1X0K5Y6_MYCSC|nr:MULTISPECIES: hypothetical protein [Mycobacterium]ASL12228.1 putative integral membrane protein [Mycobacterium intracellulare subsp. chimaera]ASL18179.1 putative integral membrane protein [Mycobacterium intracellulare subsp. chimaera]KLO35095.1 hypothetical protein ABW17_24660 [Mycobacterium nebraskense]MCV7120438.1 hypothetical protein [Mycobacterium nebraskense]MCV7328232.1 hypothetical protein [Mycobacterium intracellulare subsp. chimaera]
MRVRFFQQPWWIRWLADSVFIGAMLLVFWCVYVTHPFERAAPIVLALALVGFSAAAGAASALGQRPARAAYTEALRGLNQAERAEAVRALREGALPARHRVLAGAIRCGAVVEAYYQRASRGRTTQLISAALLAVVGIVSVFLSDPRRGTLWLLMAALFAAQTVRRERVRTKLNTHLAQLLAAADRSPEINADDIAPPPLPRRTSWQIVLFVVVVGVAGIGFTRLANHPRRDCRAADAAVSFLADNSDLTNLQLIVTGGPDLRAYQHWAEQLSHFAAQVSAPDIEPHLRAMADRASDAVSLVAQARTSPPPRPVIDLQSAYGQDMLAIIDQERSLTAACRPR